MLLGKTNQGRDRVRQPDHPEVDYFLRTALPEVFCASKTAAFYQG